MNAAQWLDWMRRLTRLWTDLLTPDGVIAINIADCYVPGTPTISSFLSRYRLACQDDIGLHELAPHYWHNPNKLPSLQWAAKERFDLCHSVEHILRFSKTPFPKADNRRVLEPYSPSTIAKWRKGRAEKRRHRASGYDINPNAFAPTGNGTIPNALIEAANSSRSDAYSRTMRGRGLPLHPARFPEALPRRLIRLHTEPLDVVYDPMDGSGTTARAAETENRRWIGSDPMLAYKLGSMTRFTESPGFVRHLSPDHSVPAPAAAAD